MAVESRWVKMKRTRCVVISLVMATVVCTTSLTFGIDESLSADSTKKVIDFHLDFSSLKIVESDGYDLIKIEGYDSFTNPGEPFLPVKNYALTFERDTEILNVKAVVTGHRDLSVSLTLAPTPSPLMWKKLLNREVKRDDNIYSSDSPFPGNYFSYDIGRDGENTYLYLHVYPVQYVPKSEKVTIITDMKIEIEYLSKRADEVPMQGFVSECVIITPVELYSQAVDLAQLHEDLIGISTTVVNTTWISSNYGEAGDPPYPGYWDNSLAGRSSIVNYDYSLAKRIISFLSDEGEHPNLSYVLLFGNGSLVPPSFYYYDAIVGGFLDYEAWIPTDFFYGSPDYDLAPNLLVGRLPVNDSQTASHVTDKIARWYDNLTGSWVNDVVIAGGRPFFSPLHIGELIVLDSVNQGFFEGANLTKMFRSDYRFDREDLLTAFSGEFSLVYVISHGGGDSILLNESMWLPPTQLNVSDIMDLEENSNVSVVVSIACDIGAFDNGVVVNRTFNSSISFGESLVFSQAGAIAFIGGSRMNAGNPNGVLEEGFLNVTSESYMADILTRVIRSYSEGAGSLGNITKSALGSFVAQNDMADLTNQRSLFEFVLLGDPILPLLPSGGTGYVQPRTRVLEPSFYDIMDFPPLLTGMIPVLRPGGEIVVNITTDSPLVQVKIVDTYEMLTTPEEVIERGSNVTTENRTSYGFMSQSNTTYLFRAESEDGKEGWLYMSISPAPSSPILEAAFLSGTNDENVTMRWIKSMDDGIENGTVFYRVMRSESLFGPFAEIANLSATGQPVYNYTDVGRGDGDISDYFYFIQAVNENMFASNSSLACKMAIGLSAGWQLVSFPLIQESDNVETVLRTLDYRSVRYFDSLNGHWMTYQAFKSYNDLKRIDNTMGLWIEVTNSDHLVLAGLVPETTEVYLHEGWNLVSFPSFTDFYPVILVKMETGAERVEGFDPLASPYRLRVMDDFEYLIPSQAYWIKVPGDVVWTIWRG
jgi:hypothetical protein